VSAPPEQLRRATEELGEAADQFGKLPLAALEYSNILLTQADVPIATTPKDVVWTHRSTTLYRYRNPDRVHPVPVLLVFALINRPDIFDLRPGHSFVEFLLGEGFDVYLLDWGEVGDGDTDLGLEYFAVDAIDWAIREMLRTSEQDEVTLLGWCIGGVLCAINGALRPAGAVRNLVLLTTPVDTSGSTYANWVGRDSFDVDEVADAYGNIAGRQIDLMNKMLKPVTNYWTTYRRLWQQVQEGTVRRDAYQSMAKWVADNPPFPSRAYREWITSMYKKNELATGRMRVGGHRVDLRNIEQNVLVVTAGADHIAPREGTLPLLDLVSSEDVTHFDRRGGHIGLMAGSKARKEIWPDIADWMRARSDR
jgi:polyhydroxyalkanoate synthase subunit PhaC